MARILPGLCRRGLHFQAGHGKAMHACCQARSYRHEVMPTPRLSFLRKARIWWDNKASYHHKCQWKWTQTHSLAHLLQEFDFALQINFTPWGSPNLGLFPHPGRCVIRMCLQQIGWPRTGSARGGMTPLTRCRTSGNSLPQQQCGCEDWRN